MSARDPTAYPIYFAGWSAKSATTPVDQTWPRTDNKLYEEEQDINDEQNNNLGGARRHWRHSLG
jgi:hypothetical protein